MYWAGRKIDGDTLVALAVVPRADHGWGHVRVEHAAVGEMARAARSHGLAILTQVHSHPGDDTRHSHGDDRLVLLPFEGMFSLVVARYGDGSVDPREGAGLHQFQSRRWVFVDPVDDCFIVVPSLERL